MSVIADHELFYTSTDDGGGPGGWQVKWEVIHGEPTPELREQLLSGVRTDLEPVGELAKFPTAAQREAFPRRLEHRALPDGRSGIWHAIPAGADGSGRPGNVAITAFALSRAHGAGSNAIDLWRSDSLPTPFGPIEVAATHAPEFPELQPGQLAAPATITNFLLPEDFREPVRVGLLARILDAADSAVRHEGAKLALLVADCDEAAHWIAAICAFAPPGWSAAFSWSTWERADRLLDPTVASLHLVAVPRADSSALTRVDHARINHARILIDLETNLIAPDLDDPVTDSAGQQSWRFTGGTHVPVGVWSGIANTCAADGPKSLVATMTTLRCLAPGCYVPDPALDLAWARAATSGDPAAAREYIRDVFNRRDWLLGEEPPRPLAIPGAGVRVSDADEAVELAARHLDNFKGGEAAVEPAVIVLRQLDFLYGCEIVVDAARQVAALAHLLTGPHGRDVIKRAAPIRSAKLRDELRHSGSRQNGRVVGWLLENPNSESGPPWFNEAAPVPPVVDAAEAAPRASGPEDWQARAWELAEPTSAWDRRPGAGPSRAHWSAHENLAEASMLVDSVFLRSPVIARRDPDIMAALAVQALHCAGGKPPADRSPADAENLLLGYYYLRDHPAGEHLLDFYLTDALREAAVVELERGYSYAHQLLGIPKSLLARKQLTTNIARTAIGMRLEALLHEDPKSYQALRESRVILLLLGPDSARATTGRAGTDRTAPATNPSWLGTTSPKHRGAER